VLVRRLLEGGFAVRVLDRLIFEHGEAIAPLLEHPGFSLVYGDLRDPEAVETALEGVSDVALLAGLVGDPITKTYPELSRAVNLDGCTALIEALDGRGLERLVFTSTCSNYGLRETSEPATEESDLAPVSLYAEHKVELEKRILALADAVDYTPTVLRISTAYGLSPRMRFDLTIAEFAVTMARGEELVVYDADTWRPYCHVQDISKAVIAVLESDPAAVAGQVFNVGHSDENYTKRMVVEVVQEALGGQGRVSFQEGGVDPRNYRVNFSKIAAALGYAPDYRVPDFVRSLVEAVRLGAYSDLEGRSRFYTNHEIGRRYLQEAGAAGGGG
jgi:nucleoside-diphosphate-sugar epimerase